MTLHEWTAGRLRGQRLRFKCDCSFKMDIIGIIRDIQAIGGEIVLVVEIEGKGGRTIKISENHPGLTVSRL